MTAGAQPGRLKGFDASRAFAQLHPSHREVVYKAYYLRLTTYQIAADLNVAEPVVKCMLHRALRKLRWAADDSQPTHRF